jgi:cell division protein FtsQ
MSMAVGARTRAEASRERRRARNDATLRSFEFTGAVSPSAGGRRRRSSSGPGASGAGSRRSERQRRLRRRGQYEKGGVLAGALGVLPSLPDVRLGWRMASLAIVIMFGALLFYVLSTPKYFVESVNLAGATYVSAEEIYEASGLNRMHIFWVRPDVIQENIAQVPGIASAEVELEWPNRVTITVVERAPVLIWQQGGASVWVGEDGALFPARADAPGLLPVLVDDAAEPLAEGALVPVAAIEGALQLRALRPNIELLHYDAVNGLSYADGRGWRGYFGVGSDMEVKLAVYETLVEDLVRRGVQPAVISVSNPDAPFYRLGQAPAPAPDEGGA